MKCFQWLKQLTNILPQLDNLLAEVSQWNKHFYYLTTWIPMCLQANSSHTVVSILWLSELQCKKGWAAVSQLLLSVGRVQAEWLLWTAAWIFIPTVQQDSIIDCSSTRYWGHTLLYCMPLYSLPLLQLSSLPLFSLLAWNWRIWREVLRLQLARLPTTYAAQEKTSHRQPPPP